VLTLAAEVNSMVGLLVHGTGSIGLHDTDFDVHALISFDSGLALWLLQHDFEEALHPGSELDDIVSIMVNCVDVCEMEVTSDKLLVGLDLVQEVGEVSVRALLLEGAACVL